MGLAAFVATCRCRVGSDLGRQYVRMIVLSLLADVDLELRVCLGVVGLVLVLVVVVGEENVAVLVDIMDVNMT